MDLRTFRKNGPGLAECESEAAWRRLWGDRRAHRSPDTRGPVSNVAYLGHNLDTGGKPIQRCARRAREKSLATELGLRGAHEMGRGNANDGGHSVPLLIPGFDRHAVESSRRGRPTPGGRRVQRDDVSLVRWNHRPALLHDALHRFGGMAVWKPRRRILAVPTEAFIGGARTVFSLAALDERREGYVHRATNPDHLVPRAPSPTTMPPLRIASRYAAGRPRAPRRD
jgi:hypothetical protein